ncbi:ABC transporter ATP-binding protein [Undibacterium cyanobacteriorum]|uniref:ABC transporter ATP-binding protein n=1 Tax=Undibacterium cyanobacteriorum TaxID=3073561 RepID=A0ABY9RNK5_9BURK|nr:ABC transporter ATP-binding protein [Undibacterium sp. 20NA77.5]WMW82546.1 ABC transporter ATP-binding protein [Undibacterium sp. 20NA77.5]
MTSIISAKGLRKSYGKKECLKSLNLEVHSGRILGLVGPNGCGKTTTINAILGLTDFEGELSVLGMDPRHQRDALMNEICFISDVAILPKWLKVSDALDFVDAIHPKFNRSKAERYLAATKIENKMRVKEMSKGMVVQLHLALVMAIDAKLLVLDEPTLGLDILYRKMFYQQLLEDYFDENKTIIVATHQIDEIENILSDLVLMRDGELILAGTMDEVAYRFVEVTVAADQKSAAQALKPIQQRDIFGKTHMLFDGVAHETLMQFGECKTPSVSDIFVAMMKGSYQ